MLTPLDIQQKKFRTGLGYEKKDVNVFIEEVVESYEKLYRNNAELQEELTTLKDTLQHYKVKEKELEKAKLLAEKDSEDTKTNAKKEAKNIELEAKNKAKIIVAEAEESLANMKDEVSLLESKYAAYKSQFASLLKAQFAFLKENDFDVDSMIDERFAGMVGGPVVMAPAGAASAAPAGGADFGTFSGDPQMRDESTLGGMSAGSSTSADGRDLTKSDSSVYTANLGSNESFVDPFDTSKKDNNRFNPFDPESLEKSKKSKPSTSFTVSKNPGENNRVRRTNNSSNNGGANKSKSTNKTTDFKEAEIPTIKTN